MAAIFQRKYERKFIVDDTEPLNATIESSHTVDGHTEYVLRVQRGLVKENSWLVHRRYNDFVALHKHLSTAGLPLPLPAKKLFGNLQPEFVAQRLNGLQQYLDVVLMNPILASSLTTRRFVDPEQYNQSFADLAIQNASLCLRNDGQYVLGASLGAIGWRLRKHYFRVQPKTGTGSRASGDYVKTGGKHVLVKSGSQTQTSSSSGAHTSTTHTTTTASSSNGGGKTAGTSSASHSSTSSGSVGPSGSSLATEQPATDLCLTWTEYGPDKYVDDRETQSIVKSLMAAHHPYVARIEYATANDSGALVVRRFAPHGSVKDQLCNAQPRQAFLHKYGNPNGRKALPLSDVALWSRQILEALRWLHERGMPNGHVHAGNVLVVDGRAKLLDVENFVLGVPAFYRPFFMQHSKIFTTECIDVYSFGHLVFEMAMGYALQESTARQSIECGAASLRSLLDSILSREACRVGLPTLEQLAAHPFFTEFAPQFPKEFAAAVAQQKPTLKLSTTAKEQLRLATQRTELRLQNEQKSTKNQKRLVKIQEMMSSEEEKKKTTKHKAKMEQKQSRLRQQNSLQLSGGPPPSTAVPFNRSDSVQGGILSPPPTGKPSTSASQSTSSSVGSASVTTTPASPPPPPPPAGPPMVATSVRSPDDGQTRSALLTSINSFNKSNLRKIE